MVSRADQAMPRSTPNGGFSPDCKELRELPVKSEAFPARHRQTAVAKRNSYPWALTNCLECIYSGSALLEDSVVLEPLRSLALLLNLQHNVDVTAAVR